MAALTGWLAVGTGVKADVFQEASGYERPSFVAQGGDHESIGRVVGIVGPAGESVTHGAVFDMPEAGHCLVYWSWAPLRFAIPGDLPAIDYLLRFHQPVQHALNASGMNGGVSEFAVERGRIIGELNGQAVTSGCRLVIADGLLHARASFSGKRATVAA